MQEDLISLWIKFNDGNAETITIDKSKWMQDICYACIQKKTVKIHEALFINFDMVQMVKVVDTVISGCITKQQYDDIMEELEGHKDIALSLLRHYNILGIAEIAAADYKKTMKEIRRLKDIKDKMERI